MEVGRLDGWKALEKLGINRKVARVGHPETIEVTLFGTHSQ